MLQYALFALNHAQNPALDNKSSLYFERGFDPITPVDLITSLNLRDNKEKCPSNVHARVKHIHDMRSIIQDKIQQALSAYEHYYNARRKDETRIRVGSLVRLNLDHIKLQVFKQRQNKLNPLWYGPFRVTAQPSTVSHTLELLKDSKIHDTFHVSKLKLATNKSLFSNLTRKQVHIPTNEDDDGDYEVERLLDHHWDHRTKSYYYLVKWKGYNELSESRWEPRAHLEEGAKEILKEYDAKHDIEVSSQRSSVEKGEDSGNKQKTRKRKTRE